MKNKKLKTMGLLVMSIAQVCMLMLCFSVAWFSARRRVDNSSTSMEIAQSDMFDISYRVFYYDEDYKIGKELEASADDPSTPQDDRLELERYDSVIKSNNANINKILRLELSNKVPTSTLTSKTKVHLTIHCTGVGRNSDNMITNDISNFVGFKLAVKHEMATIDDTTPSGIYSDVTSYVSTMTPVCFATLTSGDNPTLNTKENVIEFSNIDIDETSDKTILYLSYDYIGALVDAFVNEDEQRVVTVDKMESTIDFHNDISLLAFRHSEVD